MSASTRQSTKKNKAQTSIYENRVESLMVLKEHPSDFINEIDETLEIGGLSTKENLGFIASSSKILADRTFIFCPRHVYATS